MTILGIFLNRHIKTGAHKRYIRLLSSLAERRHDVILACPKASEAESIPSIQSLPIPELEKRFRFVALMKQLRKRNLRPGSTKLLVFGFPNAVMGLLLKYALNLPLIIGIRGYLIEARSINLQNQGRRAFFMRIKLPFVALLEGLLYRYSDIVILQSEHHKNTVMNQYRLGSHLNRKIHVIPNDIPTNVPASRKIKSKEITSFNLLFVGNNTERKGLKVLIKALGLMAREGLPRALKLRIVGVEERQWPGPPPPQNTEISAEFLGWRDDVPDLMREADLLIVPSLNEPFPNVVLEALAVDLPVIGSSVGGIQEILDDENLIFPPDDPWALKDLVLRVLKERSFYMMVNNRCLERKANFLFDWTARFERLINADGIST